MKRIKISYYLLGILFSLISVESAPQAYRRDRGIPPGTMGHFMMSRIPFDLMFVKCSTLELSLFLL
ncbi:UNVERIFIED_CONTAM: hypothetical protein Slati_1090200 [Sesamum latifolium]|uniref:Uncharacterized protein n=1 Tax=Sesamum latifolium TaxID=2727402 RepID=A0AAW2XU32_9LAMI